MRAIEIEKYGGPEVLRLCERELPRPGIGEVLIRVRAAGVNRPDVLQRKGLYPVPSGASDLPGLEVAGEIVAGDLNGTDFAIGDVVCALVQGGGYAEYSVAPVVQCLPVPSGFSMEEAASLPETFFTVWSNVFDRAGLKAGESILIHGGSSGIGVTAVQLAKAFGARVFATAGSDEKCKTVEELGAEHCVNYKSESFTQKVKELTGGRGVDVVLDMVAAKYLPANLEVLADDGRLVVIALLGGAKAELDMGQILRRRLTVTGSTLRARSIAFKSDIAQSLRRHVWPLLESRTIKPVIFQSFTLDQADQAHRLMESSAHIGKIMLRLD
ncbi:NAD(P)H-quinone oxidoreductase [Undibacterium cyanobacteriorum]|uniref:NAD(P)H-quinone oxidoreductase n=1 Tax=Undibacterium cyanobacteriorum TaxID=3073561 RepID=A0ABY9RMW6_9BURK|nr:NAD(P)H-quinone oxidoreductase [Undibacterium sp. 20NA77.5]WMW82159.1 NAD(P)H-quinone oxidoreductase [Undibacterium sp. 20NA77.5]